MLLLVWLSLHIGIDIQYLCQFFLCRNSDELAARSNRFACQCTTSAIEKLSVQNIPTMDYAMRRNDNDDAISLRRTFSRLIKLLMNWIIWKLIGISYYSGNSTWLSTTSRHFISIWCLDILLSRDIETLLQRCVFIFSSSFLSYRPIALARLDRCTERIKCKWNWTKIEF